MSDHTTMTNKDLLRSIQSYEQIVAIAKSTGNVKSYTSTLDLLQQLCHEAYTRKIAEPVWIVRVK